MSQVIVAGQICVDLTPALSGVETPATGTAVEVGPLRVCAGGAVFNTGFALASQGTAVSAVGVVGEDPLGGIVTRLLADAGLNTRLTIDPTRCTSYSIVLESTDFDRAFWHHIGANAVFDGHEIDLSGADLLHIGYPTVLPGLIVDDGTPLIELFRRAKAAGVTTSLDFCFADPKIKAGRADWPVVLHRVLPLTDVVSPSIADLVSMGLAVDDSASAVAEAAQRMVHQGVAIALVTAGPRGAYLATAGPDRLAAHDGLIGRLCADWGGAAAWIEPSAVDRIVSTTGAGDTMTAGLLHGLLQGWRPQETCSYAGRLASAKIQGRNLAAVDAPFSGG